MNIVNNNIKWFDIKYKNKYNNDCEHIVIPVKTSLAEGILTDYKEGKSLYIEISQYVFVRDSIIFMGIRHDYQTILSRESTFDEVAGSCGVCDKGMYLIMIENNKAIYGCVNKTCLNNYALNKEQ